VTYVERHPRRHTAETYWFKDVDEAKLTFPNARLLDVPQVQANSKPVRDDARLRNASSATTAPRGA